MMWMALIGVGLTPTVCSGVVMVFVTARSPIGLVF